LITLVLLLLASPVLARKKSKYELLTRPDQTVEMEGARMVRAQQKCENWAWAAALESALALQSVALDQRYWVRKAYGGEICLSSRGELANLERAVNGEYSLDNGRKLRLQLNFAPGAPTGIDELIARTRTRQPTILVWKGHSYLVAGITYQEQLNNRGQRYFVARELKLLDPYTGPASLAGSGEKPGEGASSFVNGRDDPAEIDGVLTVTIREASQGTDWLHRGK